EAGRPPDREELLRRNPEVAGALSACLAALEFVHGAGAQLDGEGGAPAAEEAGPPRALGEYRLLREVGRGGMGVVYEAVQEPLGRHVALKVLPATALLQPTQLERFRREARAAAMLHHTNIVPVFGVGEHDGTHYYAMQFIRGRSLDAVL